MTLAKLLVFSSSRLLVIPSSRLPVFRCSSGARARIRVIDTPACVRGSSRRTWPQPSHAALTLLEESCLSERRLENPLPSIAVLELAIADRQLLTDPRAHRDGLFVQRRHHPVERRAIGRQVGQCRRALPLDGAPVAQLPHLFADVVREIGRF